MQKIVFYALASAILNDNSLITGYPKHIVTIDQKIEYAKKVKKSENIKNTQRAINKKHNINYKDVQQALYSLAKMGLVNYKRWEDNQGTYFTLTSNGWDILVEQVNKDKAKKGA